MTGIIGRFSGIEQRVESAKLADDSLYYLLVNGRIRRNTIEPINLPLVQELPAGKKQGLYGFGQYGLTFIAGKAYYRDFAAVNSTWLPISSFSMSATVDRIYVAAVPGSFVNYKRTATAADEDVDIGAPVLPSPAAFIVMDGESQPWIIFPDGSARITKTFMQHTPDDPEYVPAACKYPIFSGGKLYCVGKDKAGRYTQIFHSATGQPLNFMVAVDATGGRISADEATHGAVATATNCDLNELVGLFRLPAGNDAFLACTANNSYLIIPDTDFLIYGEPFHNTQFLFPIGAINDQAVVDVMGDTAIIHTSGIRSFNAIQTLQNEGRNAPFSQAVNDIFEDVTQTSGATVSFENYVGFAVTTTYGKGTLWYDTMTQSFVSLDLYPGVNLVRQFAVITIAGRDPRLLFYTDDDKVYEAFAGGTATVRFYSRDLMPVDKEEHRLINVLPVFADITAAGYVAVTPHSDKVFSDARVQYVSAPVSAAPTTYDPTPGPFYPKDRTALYPFDVRIDTSFGSRVGFLLEFNCAAKLLGVRYETFESSGVIESRVDRSIQLVDSTKLLFVGDDGVISADRAAVNRAMLLEDPAAIIGCGDHAYEAGTLVDVEARMLAYWRPAALGGKFYAVPGNHDLDTDNGEHFFSALRQAPTRYFSKVFGFVEVFFVNSGLKTNGSQIEPDNAGTLVDSKQFRWLRDALAASTARHKIVVWHHPPHTSGAVYSPGVAAMQGIPLASWGATALVCGHSHNYERLFKDDLTHFVVGTGGRTLSGFAATPVVGSHARESRFGYLRLTATPFKARFEFVSNGIVYDAASVDV